MKIKFLLLLSLVYTSLNAQELLTVDEAISIALKNNFDILVARNDAGIAHVNNTAGNAGMLPEVRATGSGNYEVNTLHQELKEGADNDFSNHPTTSFSAGTELSWTLYDGGRMFITKERLEEVEALGGIEFRDQVIRSVYDVISAYYDVVRQNQELISISEAKNFNLERVKIAEAGYNAGSLIKPDLLQAKIDLNVTMENAINQQYVIDASKKDLNVLLGRASDTKFEVTETIPSDYMPDRDELMRQIRESNTAILMYSKQLDIAKLTLKEYQKAWLPVLNFRAGYYFSQSNSPYGTVLNNRSYGPGLAGTISIPLYAAGENKRVISGAKIRLSNAEYNLANVSLRVNAALLDALTDFENQRQLLEIERENNELTRENLEISLQRLRLGQTTSLEVHQAQDDFVKSGTRLINFEYNLKIAGTKLKQLIASL